MRPSSQAVTQAEEYYDSDAADAFYRNVWGGEDLHLGIYQSPNEDIGAASRRTVDTMAEKLDRLGPDSRMIDLGAGYGGSARRLASTSGCHVTCVNLSGSQNAINEEKNGEAGLSGRIRVVHGNFEDIPEADASFDIAWSQDAILHSGDRPRVLDEIKRVLKPGGELIFTDPMQSDDCPDGVLQPILDRIHLETLGSVAFYREALTARGFEERSVTPLPEHLRTHYARVAEELNRRYDEIVALSGRDYVDNMLRGLRHWIDGADAGYLNWGILHFRRADA